jgi:RNA polymerase sigma factor (sigma-70 family)
VESIRSMGAQCDFDALYRRHAPNAFRRAWRLLDNPSDAHEVVHDVFLALYEHPEQYSGRSTLSTFLYSAVTHACLNRLRNHSNRERLLREHAPLAGPAYVSASPEDAAEIHALLEHMPEPLAQVAVYYHLDELSHADIARIMGCSSRHVGDLLVRLRAWVARREAVVCEA